MRPAIKQSPDTILFSLVHSRSFFFLTDSSPIIYPCPSRRHPVLRIPQDQQRPLMYLNAALFTDKLIADAKCLIIRHLCVMQLILQIVLPDSTRGSVHTEHRDHAGGFSGKADPFACDRRNDLSFSNQIGDITRFGNPSQKLQLAPRMIQPSDQTSIKIKGMIALLLCVGHRQCHIRVIFDRRMPQQMLMLRHPL